jgi:hypothetical protein
VYCAIAVTSEWYEVNRDNNVKTTGVEERTDIGQMYNLFMMIFFFMGLVVVGKSYACLPRHMFYYNFLPFRQL